VIICPKDGEHHMEFNEKEREDGRLFLSKVIFSVMLPELFFKKTTFV
jgi:hypothetical protein